MSEPDEHVHLWGRERKLRYGTIRYCACGARLIVIDGHEPVIAP